MMRHSDDTGVICIKLLREAEVRGRQVIAAARERRVKRIKEARQEAETEVNQVRQKAETHLQRKLDELAEEEQRRGAEFTAEAKKQLKYMDERVKICSSTVVDMLTSLTCHIEPDVHYNLHVRQQIEATDSYAPLDMDPAPEVARLVDCCLSKCQLLTASLLPDGNNNSSSDA